MKKKLSRITGIGFSVMLGASLLVAAPQATDVTYAGTLSLSAESDIPKTGTGVLAPTSISITALAASGDVIYAATNSATYQLYRSTDGGDSWSDISSSTSFPSDVTVKAISIAADDSDVVALLHSDNQTELSTNGGSSWTDLNGPTTYGAFNDIAVSSGSTTYVALGGNSSSGAAELWTLKATAGTSWSAEMDESGDVTYTNASTINAVEFSPNWSTDKNIVVVSSNATDVDLQVFVYTSSSVKNWNDSASGFTGDWEDGIALDGIAGGLATASIALPETYLGSDESERIIFVGIAAATTTDESVYRIVDTNPLEFDTWSDGKPGPVQAIAYDDDTDTLIAGDYNASQVYSWLSPMSGSSPNAQRIRSLQQPGGDDQVSVAWSSGKAIAGTQGDESALSYSTDEGYTFTDSFLIDTELDVMDDVAVSADGATIYLATHDTSEGTGAYDASVWRKDADGWVRIHSNDDVADASVDFLTRVSPDDASVLYISSTGTTNMWVTKDSGESWISIPALSITGSDVVLDFVVESADVVYAIDNDSITKTTNAGASWGTAKRPADSMVTATISLAPNGDVLVGGSDGYVCFSTDGGSTFTRITDTVESGAVHHVVADKDYADNSIIYVAAGNEFERGKTDKDYTWKGREPSLPSGTTAMGIAEDDGIIYILTDNGTNGRIYRALNFKDADNAALALWSYYEGAAERYNLTPGALKASSGPKLWAIDTATPSLESLKDPISQEGPTLTSPANETVTPVNKETGLAYDVTFTWDRYSDTDITGMTIQISTDEDFTAIAFSKDVTGLASDSISQVIGPYAASGNQASFNPGVKYYWRVRVSDTTPAYSPWSTVNSFSVDTLEVEVVEVEVEADVIVFDIVSPARGAAGLPVQPTFVWSEYEGAIRYEVAVSESADFSILEFSRPVDNIFYAVGDAEALAYSTTYYWRARGITGEATKATLSAPGGPWSAGVFTTVAKPAKPAAPAAPVVIEEATEKEIQIVEIPMPAPAPAIPSYMLWMIISIGAILIIALIVLIVRTRRVA